MGVMMLNRAESRLDVTGPEGILAAQERALELCRDMGLERWEMLDTVSVAGRLANMLLSTSRSGRITFVALEEEKRRGVEMTAVLDGRGWSQRWLTPPEGTRERMDEMRWVCQEGASPRLIARKWFRSSRPPGVLSS